MDNRPSSTSNGSWLWPHMAPQALVSIQRCSPRCTRAQWLELLAVNLKSTEDLKEQAWKGGQPSKSWGRIWDGVESNFFYPISWLGHWRHQIDWSSKDWTNPPNVQQTMGLEQFHFSEYGPFTSKRFWCSPKNSLVATSHWPTAMGLCSVLRRSHRSIQKLIFTLPSCYIASFAKAFRIYFEKLR